MSLNISKKYINALIIFVLIATIISPVIVSAATGINKQIPYQGVLQDSAGVNVSDGNYNIVFRIYNASTNGTTLWTGTHTTANGNAVSLSEGLFRVLLGSGTGNTMTLDFTGDAYWLGVTVGSDSEMTPRQRIGATAQAFTSDRVFGIGQSAVGTTTPFSTAELTVEATTTSATPLVIRGFASQVADLFRIITNTGTQLFTFTSGGLLGIGTTTPSATFSVSGDSYFTATSTFSEGILISSSTPDVISNALYNNAGVLYWNDNIVKTAEENWTFAENYGTINLTASSTMPWWSQGSFYASSTMQVAGHSAFTTASSTDQSLSGYLVVSEQTTLGNASTTQLTNNGLSWFTGLTTLGNASSTQLSISGPSWFTGLTTLGNASSTDQSLSGYLAVTGQATFGNASTTQLSVSDKSWFTNLATFGNASTTRLSVSGSSWFTGLSTLGNASSTLFTNSGQSWFNSTSTFATDARFDTNTLVVDSFNDRVGIGTSAPETKLHLADTGSLQLILEADTDDTTETDIPSILFRRDGGVNSFRIGVEGTSGTTFTNSIANTPYLESVSNTYGLQFVTNDASRMIIDSNGNVGIGTTTLQAENTLTLSSGGSEGGQLVFLPKSGGTRSYMIDLGTGDNFRILRGDGSGLSSAAVLFIDSNDKVNINNNFLVSGNTTLTNASSTNQTLSGYLNVSGNVGIGKTSPDVSLDVSGGIRARGGTPGVNGVNNNGYAFDSAGDVDSGMFSTADGLLQFYTNSNERMRINGSGYVSIGTTTSISNLLIEVPAYVGNDTDNQQVIISNNTDTNAGLRFGFNGSTMKGYINVLDPAVAWGDLILAQGGKVGINNESPAVSLDVGGDIKSSGKIGIGIGTGIVPAIDLSMGRSDTGIDEIGSSGNGTLIIKTNGTERMRFNYDGKIAMPFLPLWDSDDRILCYKISGGFIGGEISYSGDASDCLSSSRRYKENIVDLKWGLNELMQLRPVKYNYKNGGKTSIGFIAEEVEETDLSWFVNYNEEGQVNSLKSRYFPVVAVSAIQEQQDQIEVLRNKINSLTLSGTVEEFITEQENNGTLVSNKIVAKEELCIGEIGNEVCLNKKELTELKKLLSPMENEPVTETLSEEPISLKLTKEETVIEESLVDEVAEELVVEEIIEEILPLEDVVEKIPPTEEIINKEEEVDKKEVTEEPSVEKFEESIEKDLID